MKVCTDACLFGAWIGKYWNDFDSTNLNALDIGAGTGLLSLMLAQQTNFIIDAVEINEDAYTQASENVTRSPWENKIHLHHRALQDFEPQKKYDFIFSNPPFFEGDLMSGDDAQNLAKHHAGLTLEVWLEWVMLHLNEEGKVAILLPYHRMAYFENLLNKNSMHLQKQLHVKQTPKHAFFRSMLLFSKKENTVVSPSFITIYEAEKQYSTSFVELLMPYYLNL